MGKGKKGFQPGNKLRRGAVPHNKILDDLADRKDLSRQMKHYYRKKRKTVEVEG